MKYLAYFCAFFACSVVAVFSEETESVLKRAKEDDITYVFYSREYFDGVYVTIRDLPDIKHIKKVFNPAKPTIVLIHGWKDGYGADSNKFVRKAILSKINANIIKVDWSPLAGKIYLTAKNAVPSVGKLAGQFIRQLFTKLNYSYKNLTVVGFSLGAHAAGNVGKELNGKVSQIIGLDPAGPFISSKDVKYSLHPTDAEYVQAIHTNAGRAGMTDAVGHSDFYPNGGGASQPGCSGSGCAHNRAWELFAESITNNRFVAQHCNSYNDYTRNGCHGDFKLMGGLNVDRSAKGKYYLQTNGQTPYGRG